MDTAAAHDDAARPLERSRAALAEGRHREGLEWAEQARAAANAAADAAAEADAATLEAEHLWRLGRFEDAARAAHQAVAAWRFLDRPEARCDALCLQAMACSELGLHEQGLQYASEAFELARARGLAAQTTRALNRIGICHERLGDPAQGERCMRESLVLARERESFDDTLLALNNLTAAAIGAWHLYRRTGENHAAHEALLRGRDYGREAVAMSDRLGDRYRSIVTRGNLGELLALAGEFDEAEQLLQATVQQAREGGFRIVELRTRHNLGELRAQQGRHAEAVGLLAQALDDLRRHGDHETTRMRVHAALWRSCKALGQFESALAHCEAYLAIEMQRAALQNKAQARLTGSRLDLGPTLSTPAAGAPGVN